MIYRLTWGGYYDVESNSEEKAIEQFIQYFEEEDCDMYGRTWKDLIEIEELEE